MLLITLHLVIYHHETISLLIEMPWQGSTINETWANVTNSIYEDEQNELQEDIKTLQSDVIDETTNTSLIQVSKGKKRLASKQN